LFISITVVGEAAAEDITYRNTANDGDLICVTGDLGSAYMGLLVLEREKQVFKADPAMQPALEGYDYILERQLKPEARTEFKAIFKDAGIKPTAMIDISDGLASEVLHLCHDSGLGCKLFEDKIPMDMITEQVAEEFEMSAITAALNGGEDYELLFTIPKSDYDKVKDLKDVSIIGYMTDKSESCNLITTDGASIPITAQGWDAFLNPDEKN
jgi:thiamine-monophosphate kinase